MIRLFSLFATVIFLLSVVYYSESCGSSVKIAGKTTFFGMRSVCDISSENIIFLSHRCQANGDVDSVWQDLVPKHSIDTGTPNLSEYQQKYYIIV